MISALDDNAHVLVLFFVHLAGETILQKGGEADDRVERGSQFVRDVGEELGLILVGLA